MYKLVFGLALLIAFASCKKEARDCSTTTERTFNLTGFSRITAGETFDITIRPGAAFAITASGCSNDLDDLALAIEAGATLTVKYNDYKSNRSKVHFEITLPALAAANFSGAATATIEGFDQQGSAMRVVLGGTATCRVNGLAALLRADLSGTSKLDLVGATGDLIATVSGDARLNAYTATFDDVDLYASGTAKAWVQVQKSLSALASGDSRIYYKGTPASLATEISGTAKVVHE